MPAAAGPASTSVGSVPITLAASALGLIESERMIKYAFRKLNSITGRFGCLGRFWYKIGRAHEFRVTGPNNLRQIFVGREGSGT